MVACAADQGYVRPLAVMLTSLVERLDPGRDVCAYVFDGGISPVDRERLAAALAANATIRFIGSDSAAFDDLPIWGRLSRAVYQRLMIPSLLPEGLGKAIWLDCDMVVRRDLAALWDTHLGERYLLAAQDMIVPYVSSFLGVKHHAALGMEPDGKYFNAGVMVVNLDLWRERDVVGQVVAYLRRYADDVVFLEQEALNVVLAGKWNELDPRWNQNASVSGQPFFKARHLDEQVYRRVIEDPWIVHFGGNVKPWMTGKGPAAALYFQYLDKTAWAGWRPAKSFRSALLAAYESSRVRNVVYPGEKWCLETIRRLTRKRRPR